MTKQEKFCFVLSKKRVFSEHDFKRITGVTEVVHFFTQLSMREED